MGEFGQPLLTCIESAVSMIIIMTNGGVGSGGGSLRLSKIKRE